MKKRIHKIGKFYSSMIMGNIGLFLFVGLLSVVFQEQGWFPNEDIYAISQLVYTIIIPVCISFAGGEKISGQTGGVLAVLTATGILYAEVSSEVLAGMIAAPIGGFLWKYSEAWIKEHARSSMQMLTKNLLIGVLGAILAVGGYYVLAPILAYIGMGIASGVRLLLANKLSGILCFFIEPVKILFLNNVINHGVFVPLGMQQLKEAGSSILFLLETNPGPGLGMLAALYMMNREKKETYAAAMVAEAVGGLHEVYFPVVLSDLWLLIPLMVSSFAGAWWFDFSGAGLGAPASPGSVITILLMAGKGMMLKVAVGMVISAVVSFAGSLILLKLRGNFHENVKTECENEITEEKQMPIHKIGFICDAGVGSSAMGAALFRRKLTQCEMQDIQVEAYASDQIPEDLDLWVCQKDFVKLLPENMHQIEVFPMENLLDRAAFDQLIEKIRVRNGW